LPVFDVVLAKHFKCLMSAPIRFGCELDWIAEMRINLCIVLSKNGTGLRSCPLLIRQQGRQVEWLSILPGKSRQNGLVKSFNRRLFDFRQTCSANRLPVNRCNPD
jgi:hypothetical protein